MNLPEVKYVHEKKKAHDKFKRQNTYPLIKRDNGAICVWCSKDLSKKLITFDHVICKSRGGSDWIGNLLISCAKCNRKRGNLTIEEWVKINKKKMRSGIIRSAQDRTNSKKCWKQYYEKYLSDKQIENEGRTTSMLLTRCGSLW